MVRKMRRGLAFCWYLVFFVEGFECFALVVELLVQLLRKCILLLQQRHLPLLGIRPLAQLFQLMLFFGRGRERRVMEKLPLRGNGLDVPLGQHERIRPCECSC